MDTRDAFFLGGKTFSYGDDDVFNALLFYLSHESLYNELTLFN